MSRFSFENLLSHSAEKIRRATLLVVTNFGVLKNFMLHRVMSRHDISVRCFLNHNTETFLRRTLLCSLRKNLIVKNFMGKSEGEVSRFSFESVLSHSAKKCRSVFLVFQ